MMDGSSFLTVTELPGEEISREQMDRLQARYQWAMRHAGGKDVIELACGPGPGLGLLAAAARSLRAADVSSAMARRAQAHYVDRVEITVADASRTPYADKSADLLILFEALYYIDRPEDFAAEAARLLRPGGQLLLSMPNPDLFDFAPSPFSFSYFNAPKLAKLLRPAGFRLEAFGQCPLAGISARQRLARPLKKLAVATGLMPRTMAGKRVLKRLVFGRPILMPAELSHAPAAECPTPIPATGPNRDFKVLLFRATLANEVPGA